MCNLSTPKCSSLDSINGRSARMSLRYESRTFLPYRSRLFCCFGVFSVKQGRSLVKRYGCIFTCMTVRAVHLEVLHTLSTDSFISALRRFVARRGNVGHIYSDNGTNFVGAEKALKESIRKWNQKQITEFLVQKEVDWYFNTPLASHFGGSWKD